ncbi:hypothetical protein PUN28_015210 [Cardiocondyla obscurior]|uniref:Uncharacterized protein n=1 Tax=Cardiocondyla obscurior TaxID=286306 RepID=A0AAW2F2Q0_9HYME
MKERTAKQLQRLEKKTAKMAAFLEIAKLNDKDKAAKLQALKKVEAVTDARSNSKDDIIDDSFTRKRSCEQNSNNSQVYEENIVDESESRDNNKKPRFVVS